MKTVVQDALETAISDYCGENGVDPIWGKPVVKFGDARHPRIRELRTVAIADHFMPEDFLPGAETIVSYFLPFQKRIADSNVAGDVASEVWARAYLTTNSMAVFLNRRLASAVEALGRRAGIPENIGMVSEAVLMSRWSQRHIAWISGHGTFGINNLLIGDAGCCGRYFSVVTDLPAEHDPVVERERCLFKSKNACGACVRRCVAGAFDGGGFDRRKCWDMCVRNEKAYPGADVCGKCNVGLPCSFRVP